MQDVDRISLVAAFDMHPCINIHSMTQSRRRSCIYKLVTTHENDNNVVPPGQEDQQISTVQNTDEMNYICMSGKGATR